MGWRRKRLFCSKLPDCWLKLGRRSPGAPLDSFFFVVVPLLTLELQDGNVSLSCRCCVVVFLSKKDYVLCRSACDRGVHASFVLHISIVHTYPIKQYARTYSNVRSYILHSYYTYLPPLTHPARRTASYNTQNHPCPHMRRHDTYRRTSSVPSQNHSPHSSV